MRIKTLSAVITGIYILLILIIYTHVSADVNYVLAQKSLKKGDYEKAIEQADLSVAYNSEEPRYYYGRAKVLLGSTVSPEATTYSYRDSEHALKVSAAADMVRAVELNPKNLVTLRNLVPVYYFLAVEDLSQPNAVDNIDEEYVGSAKDFYYLVKNYSPNDVGLPTLTAKYEKKLGFLDMYNESIKMVAALRPDLLEWHQNFE